MKDKVYNSIVIALCVLGVLSVLALLLYTVSLYGDSSITSYIAKGR